MILRCMYSRLTLTSTVTLIARNAALQISLRFDFDSVRRRRRPWFRAARTLGTRTSSTRCTFDAGTRSTWWTWSCRVFCFPFSSWSVSVCRRTLSLCIRWKWVEFGSNGVTWCSAFWHDFERCVNREKSQGCVGDGMSSTSVNVSHQVLGEVVNKEKVTWNSSSCYLLVRHRRSLSRVKWIILRSWPSCFHHCKPFAHGLKMNWNAAQVKGGG